jgi:hypothetical protein
VMHWRAHFRPIGYWRTPKSLQIHFYSPQAKCMHSRK